MSVADSFCHLLKIVIIPDYRKRGLGKILLENSLNQLQLIGCTQFFLEVEETNTAARDLYLSFDFKIIHRKKDFYGTGRMALIMFKS
jgi:ribosomal-protein-alanine N-acetyltransferase